MPNKLLLTCLFHGQDIKECLYDSFYNNIPTALYCFKSYTHNLIRLFGWSCCLLICLCRNPCRSRLGGGRCLIPNVPCFAWTLLSCSFLKEKEALFPWSKAQLSRVDWTIWNHCFCKSVRLLVTSYGPAQYFGLNKVWEQRWIPWKSALSESSFHGLQEGGNCSRCFKCVSSFNAHHNLIEFIPLTSHPLQTAKPRPSKI